MLLYILVYHLQNFYFKLYNGFYLEACDLKTKQYLLHAVTGQTILISSISYRL